MMNAHDSKFMPPVLRFRLNWRKCIDGIDFIAQLKPGITQYYIGKVFYFADKNHFLDWGRPISGDRYIAMEHGPVPSNIYDLLKPDSGQPDEIADEINKRVVFEQEGNKRRVYSREHDTFDSMSPSDKEYLAEAAEKYARMSFSQLRELSHREAAYRDAEEGAGLNNEMDLSIWLKEACNSEEAIQSIISELRLRADDPHEMEPLRNLA